MQEFIITPDFNERGFQEPIAIVFREEGKADIQFIIQPSVARMLLTKGLGDWGGKSGDLPIIGAEEREKMDREALNTIKGWS